jgi:hypothetical protein
MSTLLKSRRSGHFVSLHTGLHEVKFYRVRVDQEVEGYYQDGMRVPDYVTLLWADDLLGNVRRYPVPSERNRTGGAGVYYHVRDPLLCFQIMLKRSRST